MKILFECPDCGRAHDEPAQAGFVLHVSCLDCELESRYREERTVVVRIPVAA